MDYDIESLNYWSNKNNYRDLIEKFINGKIIRIEFDQ